MKIDAQAIVDGFDETIKTFKAGGVPALPNGYYLLLIPKGVWRKVKPILQDMTTQDTQGGIEKDETILLLEQKKMGTFQGRYKELMIFTNWR